MTGVGIPIEHTHPAHTVPPADVTCTERVVIPTMNPEFVPEQDGGPCPRPAVLRLTIRHDGDSCGCYGACLLTDPDRPDTEPGGPWTEVLLLCAEHAYQYQAHDLDWPAVTVEDLT